MSQLLGTTDAALRLGCSPEWVRRLADEGKLPTERTANGTRIFKASDVERLAAERENARRAKAGSEN
jgi:excisionase family DNA binding protein